MDWSNNKPSCLELNWFVRVAWWQLLKSSPPHHQSPVCLFMILCGFMPSNELQLLTVTTIHLLATSPSSSHKRQSKIVLVIHAAHFFMQLVCLNKSLSASVSSVNYELFQVLGQLAATFLFANNTCPTSSHIFVTEWTNNFWWWTVKKISNKNYIFLA